MQRCCMFNALLSGSTRDMEYLKVHLEGKVTEQVVY